MPTWVNFGCSLTADKSWGNFKTFTIKGQAKPPEGLKVSAGIRKSKDGNFILTNY